MECNCRNYNVDEEQSSELRRSTAERHPLSASFTPPQHQDEVVKSRDTDFFDPLRGSSASTELSIEHDEEAAKLSPDPIQVPGKEWTSLKRSLMQRFPVSKMVSVSSISDVIMKNGKAGEKASSSLNLEEQDDSQKSSEGGLKVISRQAYVSHLHELKDEIACAWSVEDRVTSLKLSIKVAKLLLDTTVLHFYPTLFVHVTDVLDMLGDMVWERIKRKAEFPEEGGITTRLPENFRASSICDDAKETCYNWFCKVGSIRELLPRIYLELAILPCWQFLVDQPADTFQRLVTMMRGIADPLASAYCRLYMVHCAHKLPLCDSGYLVTCVNDIKVISMRTLSANETITRHFPDKRRLLGSLMLPTIEYIIKFMFKDASEMQVRNVLVDLGLGKNQVELFGDFPCPSIIVHNILKELPTELVSAYPMDILNLIKCNNDNSFNQSLNYRLLGFKLSEVRSTVDNVITVVNKVLQVISRYDRLDEYLKVVDAYIDIILQNEADHCLSIILESISKLTCNKEIVEDELASLQSILVKLLSNFKDIEDVFLLNHFLEILDVMYGNARSVVNIHILDIATRKGYLHDPTTIQLLFGIAQALHDDIDFAIMKASDNQHHTHLISRFVQMVYYEAELEQNLTFLVECRGAFGGINEIKETVIHSSNNLATKVMKEERKNHSFVKSCITFSEVTVPSVLDHIRQLHLYLETAEVALLGGLVSHSDGLLDSAIKCLQSAALMDAGSRSMIDMEYMLSAIQKLCSFLVMVPGNPEKGVIYIPKSILSLSCTGSWMTTRERSRVCCSVISVIAALSQTKLPYYANHAEKMSNDYLFFGDSSYVQELISSTEFVLQNLVDVIEQEPSRVARGNMALEACNCVATALNVNHHVLPICTKFIETAKLSLSANDKYLQSTMRFLESRMKSSPVVV